MFIHIMNLIGYNNITPSSLKYKMVMETDYIYRKSRRDGIILENDKQTKENPEGMTLL